MSSDSPLPGLTTLTSSPIAVHITEPYSGSQTVGAPTCNRVPAHSSSGQIPGTYRSPSRSRADSKRATPVIHRPD